MSEIFSAEISKKCPKFFPPKILGVNVIQRLRFVFEAIKNKDELSCIIHPILNGSFPGQIFDQIFHKTLAIHGIL